MIILLEHFAQRVTEVWIALTDKIQELIHEPLFWIYYIGAALGLLAISQGAILLGLIIFVFFFSIEKKDS
jgi:hypothetical protein